MGASGHDGFVKVARMNRLAKKRFGIIIAYQLI